MFENEINDTYLKVEELFKPKLKTQIKQSGLIFEKLLRVENLIANTIFHIVTINGKSFTFSNLSEFYSGLLNLIKQENQELKNEIKNFENQQKSVLIKDKHEFFINSENLYQREYKLAKIIEQIKKYVK